MAEGKTNSRHAARGPAKGKEGVSPAWFAAGPPAFLLAAYVVSWVLMVLRRMKTCESASMRVFASESCQVTGLGPDIIITVIYAWCGIGMVVSIAARQAGIGILMALLLTLAGAVHLGAWYLESLLF